jgi:methylmalonyl-CoA/ethylmalonyl-CoA epimerase
VGVVTLDLDVPDVARARELFGGLLGGTQLADRDGTAVIEQPGGARIRCRAGDGGRARLRRVSVRVAGDRLDAAAAAVLLGVDLEPVRQPQTPPANGKPVADGEPVGSAGALAFDHVCFAVTSLDAPVALLRDLGGAVVFGGHERNNGTLSSQLDFGGGTRIELLAPTRPDVAVARFLDRFGPGMHHLTWKVADVPIAEAAAEAAGFATVDTDLDRRPHWRETYLRPASALGLLVQLAWTSRRHDTPLDDATLARILAGEVNSWDYGMELG